MLSQSQTSDMERIHRHIAVNGYAASGRCVPAVHNVRIQTQALHVHTIIPPFSFDKAGMIAQTSSLSAQPRLRTQAPLFPQICQAGYLRHRSTLRLALRNVASQATSMRNCTQVGAPHKLLTIRADSSTHTLKACP